MWNLLTEFKDQVTKYTTVLGQLWYLCVFVFRLIIVVTIGGDVYGGELGEFSCSTEEPGCTTMCFNQFNRISHIRFWSFQLLAVLTPTVLFHFYTLSVAGQIQKIEDDQKAVAAEKMDDTQSEYTIGAATSIEGDEKTGEKREKKLEKRKKRVGNVRFKKIYTGKELQQVPITNRIHIAYFISVILRIVLEALFLYLAYNIFKFLDQAKVEEITPLDFLFFKVPAMYKCDGSTAAVTRACSQAVSIGGVVPCWVSRPWEKTILIRYMNILSGICFLLCALELVYLLVKGYLGQKKQNDKRVLKKSSQRLMVRGGDSVYTGQSYAMGTMPNPPNYYAPGPMNGTHNPRLFYNNSSPTLTERMQMNDNMSSVSGPISRVRSVFTVPNGAHASSARLNIQPGPASVDTRPSAFSNEHNYPPSVVYGA